MPTVRRPRPRFANERRDWRYYEMRDLPLPPEVRKPLWDPPLEPDDWEENRVAVVTEWVREHPGTRPSCWWEYDDDADEPRQRVGGTGTEYWVALPGGCRETYFRGMPNRWWTTSCLAFLKCTNTRLTPLSNAVAYDENDPPLFEAEGVYLERLGLLMPGEQVADRKPEACELEPYLEFHRRLRA